MLQQLLEYGDGLGADVGLEIGLGEHVST